jgi:hypothetical protein
MLRKVERLDPEAGAFDDIGLHVPLRFVWSPLPETREPEFRTLVQEEVFDLVLMDKPQNSGPSLIRPVLYVYLTDADVTAHGGETVRCHLSVVGNEFASRRPHVWEIFGDGVWTDNTTEIAQHVRISEVCNA